MDLHLLGDMDRKFAYRLIEGQLRVIGTTGSRNYRLAGGHLARAFEGFIYKGYQAHVSGGAAGADEEAHRAAIDAGLPTVIVLRFGCGAIRKGRNHHDVMRILGIMQKAKSAGVPCLVLSQFPDEAWPESRGEFAKMAHDRNSVILSLSTEAMVVWLSRYGEGGTWNAILQDDGSKTRYALSQGRFSGPMQQLVLERGLEWTGDPVEGGREPV